MYRSRFAEARALSFQSEDVGRSVKASKKLVTWKFWFEGEPDEHAVVLKHSVLSGKKVVFVDGVKQFEEQKMMLGQFRFPFQVSRHSCVLLIDGDSVDYDLRLDDVAFRDLHRASRADMLKLVASGDDVPAPRPLKEFVGAEGDGGAPPSGGSSGKKKVRRPPPGARRRTESGGIDMSAIAAAAVASNTVTVPEWSPFDGSDHKDDVDEFGEFIPDFRDGDGGFDPLAANGDGGFDPLDASSASFGDGAATSRAPRLPTPPSGAWGAEPAALTLAPAPAPAPAAPADAPIVVGASFDPWGGDNAVGMTAGLDALDFNDVSQPYAATLVASFEPPVLPAAVPQEAPVAEATGDAPVLTPVGDTWAAGRRLFDLDMLAQPAAPPAKPGVSKPQSLVEMARSAPLATSTPPRVMGGSSLAPAGVPSDPFAMFSAPPQAPPVAVAATVAPVVTADDPFAALGFGVGPISAAGQLPPGVYSVPADAWGAAPPAAAWPALGSAAPVPAYGAAAPMPAAVRFSTQSMAMPLSQPPLVRLPSPGKVDAQPARPPAPRKVQLDLPGPFASM